MKKEIVIQLNKTFEDSAYTQNGVEYWMARICRSFWIMRIGAIFYWL